MACVVVGAVLLLKRVYRARAKPPQAIVSANDGMDYKSGSDDTLQSASTGSASVASVPSNNEYADVTLVGRAARNHLDYTFLQTS
jgi:hypothetical protein